MDAGRRNQLWLTCQTQGRARQYAPVPISACLNAVQHSLKSCSKRVSAAREGTLHLCTACTGLRMHGWQLFAECICWATVEAVAHM